MRETIILVPSANSAELLRMMAKHGKKTLGLRILSAAETAERALVKNGRTIPGRFINNSEAAARMYDIAKDIRRFGTASFSSAKDIMNTVNSVRKLIPVSEQEVMHSLLSGTVFPENGAAVCEAYDRYMSTLEKDGLTDEVSLIRLAAELPADTDADYLSFEEYPLTPLEKHLLGRLSGGRAETVTLCGFIGAEKKPVSVSGYTEAYGAVNEVREIIAYIYRNKLPLDSCMVVCAEPREYSALLREMSQEFGIPMTFAQGVPVTESNAGKLLKSYFDWNTAGFNGRGALRDMIFSGFFDSFALREKLGIDAKDFVSLHRAVDLAGDMQLSADAASNKAKLGELKAGLDDGGADNKVLALAELLAHELEKGCAYWVGNYYFRRRSDSALDKAGADRIVAELEAAAGSGVPVSEIIPAVLSSRICAGNCKQGALHVTSVSGALSALREHIFIAGMSAANYPGMPAENYLLTDGDLARFGETAPTSEYTVRRRIAELEDLVVTASSLGADIRFSYSCFDTAELKEINCSSLLLGFYKSQHGDADMETFRGQFEHTEFFSSVFCPSDNAAKAYAEGRKVTRFADKPDDTADTAGLDLADFDFGITNIEKYLVCPRRFFYAAVLRIGEPETYDPFVLMDHREKGNLFHKLMEENATERLPLDKLREKAGKMWDNKLRQLSPLNSEQAEAGRQEFIDMAEYAYWCDKDNKVEDGEKPLSYTHSSGLRINGKTDRLEYSPEGTRIVADFKTGKSDKYKTDDFGSCLQVILYALMLGEEKDASVRGEYRFVKEWVTVTCSVSGEMLDKADKLLTEIAGAVKTCTFRCNTNECTYCAYKGICDREGS